MKVEFDQAWVQCAFLLSIRLGVLFMSSPVFSGLGGLVTVRVLLTLALSGLLASGAVPLPAPALGNLVSAALAELATGSMLAFGLFAAFGAFSLAGKLLDIQSGFGIGSVYDPVTRGGAPLFATMLNMAGVVAFFALDAHHAMMQGIAFSLQRIPPGTPIAAIPLDAILAQFGLMFSLGVALMIPAIVALLLVEAGLAVVSRVLPQMNVIMVMVPAKVIAGLAVFALAVGTARPVMARVFASVFAYWEEVLA